MSRIQACVVHDLHRCQKKCSSLVFTDRYSVGCTFSFIPHAFFSFVLGVIILV
uniref:Uncharacterized protein n=1 Tax=Arundo donax TaxID=35708 RepID=A0A0A9EJ76_ARUDO